MGLKFEGSSLVTFQKSLKQKDIWWIRDQILNTHLVLQSSLIHYIFLEALILEVNQFQNLLIERIVDVIIFKNFIAFDDRG